MVRAKHARRRISRFALLFRDSEPSRFTRPQIVVAYLGGFVVISFVSLARQSGVRATNSLWAEDGSVFYQQSVLHPFLHNLVTPYAGYFQLFPRLAIEVVRPLPLIDVAGVAAVIGATSLAFMSLFVYHASRAVLAPIGARALLAGAMALLPLATGELLNNVVNVPWWLFFAAFWALLWRPRTAGGSVVAGVICLLAAGSDPLVGLFLPIAALRLFALRARASQACAVGLVLGLGYQLVGVLRAGSSHQGAFSVASYHGITQAMGLRVGWGWLTGNDLTNRLIASHNAIWFISGYLLIVVIWLVAMILRDWSTFVFVSISLVFALVTFAAPVWVRGGGSTLVAAPVAIGSRYGATPILLVWAAVLAEGSLAFQRTKRPLVGSIALVACAVVLVPVWVVDFRPANLRSRGPAWSAQVARGDALCLQAQLRSLNISPTGWRVVLPCQLK